MKTNFDSNPAQSNRVEVNGNIFERTAFPVSGRHVRSYFEKHPEVALARDIWPDFLEINSRKPEITMVFPGYKYQHSQEVMGGGITNSLIHELNNTVGFVNWMNTTHIDDLVACGIADHLEQGSYQGLKMFGTSHGGYFALKLASFFHKLSLESEFSVPIQSLVVAVAPTSKESFKMTMLPDPSLIFGLGHIIADNFVHKQTGKNLYVPKILQGPRSDVVRLIAVQDKGFVKGDFPDGFTVHYFATDATSGKIDKLVDQPKSIANLRESGVNVILHEFTPGDLGHVIHKSDRNRMNSILTRIFKSSDISHN